MEELGGTFGSASSRDNVMYTANVLDSSVGAAMEILGNTVLNSDLKEWEVDTIKAGTHLVARAEAGENPSILLSEAVCAAAFKDSSPLGHPMIVEGPSTAALGEYVGTQYVGGNITVAGAGCTHDELNSLAQAHFGGAANAPPTMAPASPYSGGEVRVAAAGGATFMALGFEGAGLKSGDLATMLVLEAVLSGKGLSGFSVAYGETGLFGVHAAAAAGTEQATLDEIVAALKSGASDAEVNAAKAKVGVAAADSKAATAEYFATTGKEAPPAVGGVSTAAVSDMLKKATGSAPFLASLGSMATMPSLDSVKF
jgi:predicted Zn-dependent peptidase